MTESNRSRTEPPRRRFLKQGLALLGVSGLAAASGQAAETFEPPETPPWMKAPGAGMSFGEAVSTFLRSTGR